MIKELQAKYKGYSKMALIFEIAKIREDTIDDAIHSLDNSKVNCHEDYVDGIDFAIGVLRSIAENLKEQNSN